MDYSKGVSPGMPVEDDSTCTCEPASPRSDPPEPALPPMAVTNYGSQIKFNYGTISNYFCHHDHDAHHSAFLATAASLPSQLQTKIQTGCALYKSEEYISAKVIFYEVLHAKDSSLSSHALLQVKYDLARVHFTLLEYQEAARNFEEVVDAVENQEHESDNE
ncbi:hypothetical protein F5Y16DRAFT_79827 [Xylariaceae sp. FL0255]|nr:hypothetical protein F5Y16DRAFT_79827 [Xylariaceae sp. FL0255]